VGGGIDGEGDADGEASTESDALGTAASVVDPDGSFPSSPLQAAVLTSPPNARTSPATLIRPATLISPATLLSPAIWTSR
jgi:hypothetical protein